MGVYEIYKMIEILLDSIKLVKNTNNIKLNNNNIEINKEKKKYLFGNIKKIVMESDNRIK